MICAGQWLLQVQRSLSGSACEAPTPTSSPKAPRFSMSWKHKTGNTGKALNSSLSRMLTGRKTDLLVLVRS